MTVNYRPEQTGIAVYTTGLAEGLAARGFAVSVLAAAPHYPVWKVFPSSEWAPDEIADGVRVRRLRSYVPGRASLAKRSLFELLYGLRFVCSRAARRQIASSDAVLLVSPALLTSALVRLSVHRARTRTVLWVQDRYCAGMREVAGAGVAARAIAAVETGLARSCDDVVVIHDRWRAALSREWGIDECRLTTIRNWSHLAPSPDIDRASVRTRLGWGDETVVLHAGNMGAKQGLENVVAAARHAEAKSLPLRFVLLGDGNQRQRLELDGAGCACLEFIRPLADEQYAQALEAADVLLVNELPGLAETAVPSKLTSYFAVGRPVLAATEATSVTSDEIRASGAGKVIPPGDPEALVDTALELGAGSFDLDAGPRYVERILSPAAAIDSFAAVLAQRSSSFAERKHHRREGIDS
ncbi:MAG: glycosyltransferase family 4 protein [Propionicimonas sp.]|nr:glycosyltransferase family 4 protein [Propionicimonas sp.]